MEDNQKKIKKITPDKIISDFKRAREYRRKWIEQAIEDLEFKLGQQWTDSDKNELEEKGVLVLTINKVHSNMLLLTGIQSQNRSEFKAFPIGSEDQIKSDIATLLLKNAMDNSEGPYKISEQFEDGATIGEGWLEPFVDYSGDLLNGTFKIKKGNPLSFYVDPVSVEYDLSDAEYIIKYSPDLTENQLYKLFPKKKSQIDKIRDGKLNLDNVKDEIKPTPDSGADTSFNESRYDLVEYYYQKYVNKYYVIDKENATVVEYKTKSEAQSVIDQIIQSMRDNLIEKKLEIFSSDSGMVTNLLATIGIGAIEKQKAVIEKEVADMNIEPTAEIIEHVEPEIWQCDLIGTKDIIYEGICWSYPKWKGYPVNRFTAYTTTIPIKKKELMTFGIVRPVKSVQLMLNKSSTLELRHLNATANSGWLSEEGSFVDPKKVEKFGSVPGVNIEYKKTVKFKPERMLPQPLSTGHQQISINAGQYIKDILGINSDLLAMTEGGQSSGRAIALRQKQGLLMVQRLFDNLSRSQKLLGKFTLSILGDIYTVETAIRVIGEQFIKDNFSVPQIAQDPVTGQPVPAIDPLTGTVIFDIDKEKVYAVISEVLNDTGLGKYDVAIGEGVNSDTVKYTNGLLLKELADEGVPIPPGMRIDQSSLPQATKNEAKKYIDAMMAAGAKDTGGK